ncbi:MAG: DVUA0089 family protein, partial [Allosphingosinicella sp.]
RTPGAGTIIGNSLNFASDGEIVVEAGSVVAASALVGFDSGEDLEIRGEIYAPVINLRSVDIEIDAGGVVGDEDDPGEVNLIVVPSGEQTELGDGLPGGDGYKLTQDEVERIEASRATVTVSPAGNDPAREPDVLIGDLVIAGSEINGPSSVSVVTNGTLRVVGIVEYAGAAAGDTLLIRADERLEVITPTGGIGIFDSNDELSGQLQLSSSNIVVADADLAARLAEDSEFDGRDEALRTNSGAVNEAGYLQAGGIGLFSGGNIFVQNTGTATNFAGLTVGGGGLLIGSVSQVPGGGGAASFRGTLITANDVLTFEFTINSDRTVTLRSYSYAGGTNAAGEVIPAGGFDPILALFNAAGALIGQNDDGGSNVPADPVTGSRYDVFLQVPLTAGSYRVTVTAFSNFANGPNLSDGFEGDGNFNQRSSNFAFDVLGADSVTGPGQQNPTLTLVAFGRRQNADGTFTGGRDFFGEVDFGTGNGVTYTDLSEFNGCFINNGCGVVAPPPNTTNATVLIATLEDPGSEAIDDGEEDGGPTFGTNFVGIVDTGNLSAEQLIDQAVLSGGDSTAWGEECAPDEPECEAENEGPVP